MLKAVFNGTIYYLLQIFLLTLYLITISLQNRDWLKITITQTFFFQFLGFFKDFCYFYYMPPSIPINAFRYYQSLCALFSTKAFFKILVNIHTCSLDLFIHEVSINLRSLIELVHFSIGYISVYLIFFEKYMYTSKYFFFKISNF